MHLSRIFLSQISAQYFIKTVKAIDVKKYALTCYRCFKNLIDRDHKLCPILSIFPYYSMGIKP